MSDPSDSLHKRKKRYETAFPIVRIKKIMQVDAEVGKLATTTPALVCKNQFDFLTDFNFFLKLNVWSCSCVIWLLALQLWQQRKTHALFLLLMLRIAFTTLHCSTSWLTFVQISQKRTQKRKNEEGKNKKSQYLAQNHHECRLMVLQEYFG